MPTWLLLGIGIPLAAAAVPIIIHLINLTRYRKVDWAAMEFLLKAYEKTRRRMQLESLIMLLLRIAAVLLIAMALFPMGCEKANDWAGDKLGLNRGSLNTDAPLHLLLVLDNSASMGYQQENQAAFDRARQYALGVVDSLQPNRDRVSIIRLSDVYVPPGLGGEVLTEEDAEESRERRVKQVSSLNLDAARREIAATQIAAVNTNMVAAFREVSRLADRTPAGDAVGVVVVSDFYSEGWRNVAEGGSAHTDFLDIVNGLQERISESGTTLHFYDAGFANTQNIAITNVSAGERVIGNGMEASVFVDVVNYASSSRAEDKTVRLKYRVDGGAERSFRDTFDLPPGQARRRVQLTLPPDEIALTEDEMKTGASRNIEIFTTDADALKIDNSRNFVIHVVPNVPILLVNGAPHPDPSVDETFYLETALGISSSQIEGETRVSDVVKITPNKVVTMRAEELNAVDSLLDYRLVVLANVSDISENVAKKLTEFVDAGYGLIIFDGDKVDHQKYNNELYRDGRGILPVKLGRPGGSDNKNTARYHRLSIVQETREHPVIALFTETDDTISIITEPEAVHNWRTVTLPEGDEADPLRPTRVLLKLNVDDAPFLVERPYGRGRVMYVATTAGEKWNSLWRSNGLPLFLYLEMAGYLTNNEARFSNLSVGEPYRRVLRVNDIAPIYDVRDPAGTTSEVVSTSEEGLQLLEFAGTAQPGVYTVTARDRVGEGETRQKWQERFAVNLEPGESDVTRLMPTGDDLRSQVGDDPGRGAVLALEEALGDIPFEFQRAGDELEGGGALAGEKGDREWLWLAVLGAAFLLFETLWSGVISKPEE